jgi:Xaa-Pro aminopeptidase
MDSFSSQLAREKLAQAITLLQRYDIDLWLNFVQETSLRKDPALDLILPFDVTWQSAFLVNRNGRSIAIAGRYDAANLERLQAYSQVIAYDQSIRPALVEALRRLRPQTVAVNFSRNDPAADGLTHGLWLVLEEILAQADFPPEQILSAEAFLGSLRGQKTPSEVKAIRGAVATTEALLHEVTERIRPGVTERELAAFLHARMAEGDLAPAWDLASNPIVNTGPESEVGHAGPTDLAVQPGHLVHFDFGVKQNGYCADLQRMWYVLEAGAESPPPEVMRVWQSVRGALLAGAAALVPGARGWEVDQAARNYLVARGLPEYAHAFGHHVGRFAHDGATVLGPRWERYGQTPYGLIEAGNVFAIELGAAVPGRGSIYLEENVLVTEWGLEWLSEPQTELRLIRV